MEKWQFYVREALRQLDFAQRSYAEFEKAIASNDTDSVFYSLHHFIIHLTNVDKLLDVRPETDRAHILSGHVDIANVDLKPIRRLRNHLEHFDERLDAWIANHDGHAFFDMNIVTGATGFPEKTFLRAIDGDVFKFYGEAFPLVPILESAKRLRECLLKPPVPSRYT